MTVLEQVSVEELPAIALGAAILGTGGGGDPWIGRMLASAALSRHGAVRVLSPADLREDDFLISVAGIGTPSVLIESPPGPEEFEWALQALEQRLGRTATAILPIEMGGFNSLVPLLIAARRGLPVVDADGMGRAFPEMQMLTFNVYGQSATPLVMTSPSGDRVTIETTDNTEAERLARQMVVAMGGAQAMACYPMTGAAARACVVPATLSLAYVMGRAVMEGRRQGTPIQNLLAVLAQRPGCAPARVLMRGRISDVQRMMAGGWTSGRFQVEGLGEFQGRRLEVDFRNEYLRAQENGTTLTIVPDLLAALDTETGEPFTCDGLGFGRRVTVLAIPAADVMRTPEALRVFGPGCFGYDEPFVPAEAIQAV